MLTKAQSLALLLALIPFGAQITSTVCLAQQAPVSPQDKAALQKLVEALGSPDFRKREEAQKRLVSAGEPALELVRQAAKSPDPEVAHRVQACIKEIEQGLPIARLVAQLQAKTPAERVKAARRFLAFGPTILDGAVPALIRALDDPDPEVRTRVMGVLGYIGPAAKTAVPRILTLAQDAGPTDTIHEVAAVALGSIGEGAEEAIPYLLKLVKSQDIVLVYPAAAALGSIGKKNEAVVVPVLFGLLKHENALIRGTAAAALGQFGKADEAAQEVTRQAAKSVDGGVRGRAAAQIKEIEWDLQIAKLGSQLQAKTSEERLRAARGLNNLAGPGVGVAVLPALILALDDPDPKVRSDVIGLLCGIGSAGKVAVPALIRALDDSDPELRGQAITALGSIGPAALAALPRIRAVADDARADPNLRMDAILALRGFGDAAGDFVPSLLRLTKSQIFQFKMSAIVTLGGVGKKHDAAVVPVLLDLLKHDEDPFFRGCAAGALGNLGKQPSVVVPALVEQLKEEKPAKGFDDPQFKIFRALGLFQGEAKLAVPALLNLLTNKKEDKSIRLQVIWTLAAIGPEAKEAIPTLTLIKDGRFAPDDPYFRKPAADALAAIQEASK